MSHASKRQLFALMFCDLVGYGTITTQNETFALELLEEYRAVVRRFLPLYGGRENKTIGDGFFVEFGSAIEAVLCAIEVQTCLYERNLGVPHDRRILARIGIHLGDVVITEGDSLGQGVNVAARIEAFAEPGGICVSRSVADQLFPYEQIRLRRLGKRALKHISRPASLYKVVLPWDKSRARKWWAGALRMIGAGGADAEAVPGRWHRVALGGIAGFIFALFTILVARTFIDYRGYDLRHARAIAGDARPRVMLGDGWEWTHAPFDGTLDDTGTAGDRGWSEMRSPYHKYADEMAAPYWMRRRFESRVALVHPTITLGPISGAHRAYLNGKFIGGSDFTFTLAYYSFDPSLLKSSGDNSLVVKVNPKQSITPGIVHLPPVPSFLGEFSDVYSVVIANELYFHVAQNIYLVLALLSFLGSLVFWIFNRHDRKYLYFSLYLLLGAMSLMHSNGFVFGFLDFRLQRAFRLCGLSLGSLMLLSSYFNLIGLRKWETANNVLALAWSAVLSALIFSPDASSVRYLAVWNTVLGVTFAWTGFWVSVLFNYRLVSLVKGGTKPDWRKLRYEAVVLLFGSLAAMLAFSSLKTPVVSVVPYGLRSFLFGLGTTYPFWFACSVIGLALVDYIAKAGSARYRRRTDDLFLGIAEAVRHSASTDEIIPRILEIVTEFVRAERSTVYLLDESGSEPALRAHSIFSSHDARPLIRKVAHAKGGILGYICQSKAPLLIRDISSDLRFQDHVSRRKQTESDTYRTNSCMLFPLVISHRLVGVLTIADKAGRGAFSERDFSILHVATKDLATVMLAQTLQNKASRGSAA